MGVGTRSYERGEQALRGADRTRRTGRPWHRYKGNKKLAEMGQGSKNCKGRKGKEGKEGTKEGVPCPARQPPPRATKSANCTACIED